MKELQLHKKFMNIELAKYMPEAETRNAHPSTRTPQRAALAPQPATRKNGRSEERPVTVLFTDIVGFTTVCEKLDATQVADFLNRHFGLLAGCIEAEGGTVDKYIGDSVMAFWGAPDDQPDQAERACREVLALPVYGEMTAGQQERVVASLATFFGA